MAVVFIRNTDTSPWSRPGDFTNAGHQVELVGAGGDGAAGNSGTNSKPSQGGSGAAYVKLTNPTGTLGSTTAFRVLADSTGSTGTFGASIWGATVVVDCYYAEGGRIGATTQGAGPVGGSGGNRVNGSPSPVTYVEFGQTGGAGGATTSSGNYCGGSGGGGAAGPDGGGAAGGAAATTASFGGGGGGGGNGGGAGSAATSGTGGNGGTNRSAQAGGTGGTTGSRPGGNASNGGSGGGGGFSATDNATSDQRGGSGAQEIKFTQTSDSATAGPGGGGGGGGGCSVNSASTANGSGGAGGGFGSGGGGGGSMRANNTRAGGAGSPGLIIITYTPTLSPGLYDATDTLFPPNVVFPQALTASLFGSDDAFFTQSVGRVLLPGLFTDADGFFTHIAGATETLHPDADSVDGNWVTETGGTNLFASIDESVASDADYIMSGADPISDICRVSLSNPALVSGAPLTIKYRYKKFGTKAINLIVRVYDSSNLIATFSHSDISTSFVTATQQFMPSPDISGANNLFLEFEARTAPNSGAAYVYRGGSVNSLAGDTHSASIDIGTASSDRLVLVAVWEQNFRTISAVSVAGTSLSTTPLVSTSGLGLYAGLVTTGDGSQTVSITATSSNFESKGFQVWTLTGLSSNTPKQTASGSGTTSIPVDAEDFLFAFSSHASGVDVTYSGSSETPDGTHVVNDPTQTTFHTAAVDWTIDATNASFSIVPSTNVNKVAVTFA